MSEGAIDGIHNSAARSKIFDIHALSTLIGLSFFWQFFRSGFWRLTLVDSLGILGGTSLNYSITMLCAGLLALAALFFKKKSFLRTNIEFSKFVIPLCGGASLICFLLLLIPIQNEMLYILMGGLRILVLAVVTVVLTVGWGVAVASHFDRSKFVMLASSYFFSFVLTLPELFPEPYNHFVVFLSPLCSGLMLLYASHGYDFDRERNQSLSKKMITPSLLLLAFLPLVASVAKGLLYDGKMPVSENGLYSTTIFSLVFSLFLILVTVFSMRKQALVYVNIIWAFFVVLYLFGIFWIVAYGDIESYLGRACMLFTGSCFWFLLFIVLAERISGGYIAAETAFLLLVLLETIAALVSYTFIPYILSFGILEKISRDALFLAISLMFVIASFAFLSMNFSKRDSGAGALKGTHLIDEACKDIADRFHLTAREEEVLRLVPSGYTYKKIGAILFISSNTVLCHMKSIYRKTGSHGKQELIDLIEASFPS